MTLQLRSRTTALLALSLLATACGTDTSHDDHEDPTPSKIEVAGEWDDNYGGSTTITNTAWGSAAITKYSNAARFAITQNPANAEFSPGKFNKNVWTALTNGTFYFCTVDFGKDTAAEAENTTKTADANDLNGAGCGGFAWTKMVVAAPKIAIIGTWDDTWGSSTTITKDKWGSTKIAKFDNAKRYAITQNPADAMWSPNKFSKYVWTAPQGNSFYYCTVEFDQDTAEAAENTAKTADENDLNGKGCGGFSWTKYVAHSPIEVAGTWNEEFAETPTTITASKWGASTVTKYNNAMRYSVVQAPADAEWGANKFSKFVWTPVESNVFFYCIIEYGKDTADEAENTTNIADPSSPTTGGCGGFKWTKMTLKTN
jgi:hypothetical protein